MVTNGKCLMQTDWLTYSHTPNLDMLSHLKTETIDHAFRLEN